MEQIASRPADADHAVAVRAAKAFPNRIDDGELLVDCRRGGVFVPAGLPNTSQQRPQVIIDSNLAEAVGSEGRTDDNGQQAQLPPAGASGIRCRSSGSTIQPRQLAAPHRQGIAASAGQQ